MDGSTQYPENAALERNKDNSVNDESHTRQRTCVHCTMNGFHFWRPLSVVEFQSIVAHS